MVQKSVPKGCPEPNLGLVKVYNKWAPGIIIEAPTESKNGKSWGSPIMGQNDLPGSSLVKFSSLLRYPREVVGMSKNLPWVSCGNLCVVREQEHNFLLSFAQVLLELLHSNLHKIVWCDHIHMAAFIKCADHPTLHVKYKSKWNAYVKYDRSFSALSGIYSLLWMIVITGTLSKSEKENGTVFRSFLEKHVRLRSNIWTGGGKRRVNSFTLYDSLCWTWAK